MRKLDQMTHRLLICIAFLVLLACSSSSEEHADSGGIGGSGINEGEVTEYGSIFVNDIEMDTSAAKIYVEGELMGTGDAAVHTYLPIGQRVVVRGGIADTKNGTAVRVDAFYRVRGPVLAVDDVDEETLELDVMGQTVYVAPNTTTYNVSANGIVPDMVLEVSGAVDGDGAIHAGMISLIEEPDPILGVKGAVADIDPDQLTIRINALTVDFSLTGTTAEALTDGQAVAVRGTLSGGQLIASTLEPFETGLFDKAEQFIIDGFITASDAASQLQMGPYQLDLESETLFEELLPEELEAGLRVRVQGTLRNRVIQAARVAPAFRVRMESNVTAVDDLTGQLTLDGMPALTIDTNQLTRVHGNATALTDIAVGDHVRVFGMATGANSAMAATIFESTALPQDDRWVLQGLVTAVAPPLLSVMGNEIDTAGGDAIQFYNSDDEPISAEDFFSAVTTTTVVRVYGLWEADELVYQTLTLIR